VRRPSGPIKAWQRRWKDGWPQDLAAPGARRAAALDMLIFDHGLVRLAWRNLHEVEPGVWRGNQPDPALIRRLAARGFRSVLNLRGATEWGSYLLEREACRAAGIELVDYKLTSRRPPTREEILGLDAIFGRIERPFLIHCKSGADRAGFAAAVYLLLRGAAPERAVRQLSWRYLHLRGASTGVLHLLIARYATERARTGIDFRAWVAERYDPAALAAAWRPRPGAELVLDRMLQRE
jgi:protein tyrosine/serine phosphatase